jgi:hypothetical protein
MLSSFRAGHPCRFRAVIASGLHQDTHDDFICTITADSWV